MSTLKSIKKKKGLKMKEKVERDIVIDSGLHWENLDQFKEWSLGICEKYSDLEITSMYMGVHTEYDYEDSYDTEIFVINYLELETDEEYNKRIKKTQSSIEFNDISNILLDKGIGSELANSKGFQKLYKEGKIKID